MEDNDTTLTAGELARRLRGALAPLYGKGEAAAMTLLIFHHLKGWNQTDLVINGDTTVSGATRHTVAGILRRLLDGEPIQYVLGEASFYGMNLRVNRNVLIPRPETAQLVDIIADRFGSTPDLRVLDIGTGSGAIAIALSRNLPFSRVTAIDNSPGALEVARDNASRLKAKIDFRLCDIFTLTFGKPEFDIFVSNPPYIDESERGEMERNVLDYEPASALFVPDDNPLVYYSRIIETAQTGLRDGGHLYFEINPRHADSLRALMENGNFREVSIIDDSFGRRRFITGTLAVTQNRRP